MSRVVLPRCGEAPHHRCKRAHGTRTERTRKDGMIHHVFANKSNAGDWLAARAMQSLLRGVPIREHFCDEPFVEQTLHALGAVRDNDLVLIGAGGLLMDYFMPFWEGFRALAPRLS